MNLHDAILQVLKRHKGAANKIKRNPLHAAVVSEFGQRVGWRTIRENIELLRKETYEGAAICSTTEKGGGYWMAANRLELAEYLGQEERRAKQILQKIKLQRERAKLDEEATQLMFKVE